MVVFLIYNFSTIYDLDFLKWEDKNIKNVQTLLMTLKYSVCGKIEKNGYSNGLGSNNRSFI